MTTPENKEHWIHEVFSDSNGRLSSFRIMAMMGMVVGCVVLLAQAFGEGCGVDLSTTLAFLFGAVFGGKALQKTAEK